jgi:ribosomal protein L32E
LDLKEYLPGGHIAQYVCSKKKTAVLTEANNEAIHIGNS